MQVVITFWRAACALPLAWHKILGQVCGSLLLLFANKRRKIAQANIQVCLPLLSLAEQRKLLHKNFISLGHSLFQTGVAWFWSDARIEKNVAYKITGLDLLKNHDQSKGNLILFKHSQHLELDARLLGMNIDAFGVARSHNSSTMDVLQTTGRLSSIKGTADKNNPRQFVKWLKEGKNVLYAIDQDYGWSNSVELTFFNNPAATITTTRKIIDMTQCNLLFMNSFYKEQELNLELEILSSEGFNANALAQKINDVMEKSITLEPAEYLWSHRRFKSTLGKQFYN